MVLKERYTRKFVNITSPEALWTNRPPLLHTRRVALLTLTPTLFGHSYVKHVHFIILQYNISTVLNFANGCELHSWCRYYTDQTSEFLPVWRSKISRLRHLDAGFKKTKRVKIYRVYFFGILHVLNQRKRRVIKFWRIVFPSKGD